MLGEWGELHAIVVINVLVGHNLVTRGVALTRDDGAPGKENLPDLVEADAVLHRHLFLHLGSHPVVVPVLDGVRVVHANGLDGLDFESCGLQLSDVEGERKGCICTGEDVGIHEETPQEILPVERTSQAGNLQVEHTIVLQHAVHLFQEIGESADTDVFGHLEAGDFVVFHIWNFTVVLADEFGLVESTVRLLVNTPCNLKQVRGRG